MIFTTRARRLPFLISIILLFTAVPLTSAQQATPAKILSLPVAIELHGAISAKSADLRSWLELKDGKFNCLKPPSTIPPVQLPAGSRLLLLDQIGDNAKAVGELFIPTDAVLLCKDLSGLHDNNPISTLITTANKGAPPLICSTETCNLGATNPLSIRALLEIPTSSTTIVNSHITLLEKRAGGGDTVNYKIQSDVFGSDKIKAATVFFRGDTAWEFLKSQSMDLRSTTSESSYSANATLPNEGDYFWSQQGRAVFIITRENNSLIAQIDDIRIVRSWVAFSAAVLIVLGIYGTVVAYTKSPQWSASGTFWPVKYLLAFSVTPTFRYSLSLAQGTWWTLIVGIAYVYVALSRAEFLSITTQILTLLGISAGTAIGASAIKKSGVPAAAFARCVALARKYNVPLDRIPQFSDLVSNEAQPNILKFQSLLFNFFIGLQVMWVVSRTGAFPAIDDSLWKLLGVSSAAYIGNELVDRNQIKETLDLDAQLVLAEEIERKKTNATTAASEQLKDDIIIDLKTIFSKSP